MFVTYLVPISIYKIKRHRKKHAIVGDQSHSTYATKIRLPLPLVRKRTLLARIPLNSYVLFRKYPPLHNIKNVFLTSVTWYNAILSSQKFLD